MISQQLIDQIVNWKKQGYSDDSIMQYLQSQGYSDSDIFAALNQANSMVKEQPVQEKKEEEVDKDEEVDTEELIEQIIDEKWQDLSQDIKSILEWKTGIESSIARLDERLKAVENKVDMLYKSIIERIADYDKHISIVSGELKAMEKSFSNFLPELTKAIQALKSINNAKTKKKK